MTIEVRTAPAFEPVSLAEARLWLRIDSDDTAQDSVITMLIAAMRRYAENYTGRAFVSRALRLTLGDWPYHAKWGVLIELPSPPLISVDAFKYTDTDGVLQTLASTQYVVHEWRAPAWIVPAYSGGIPVTWPTIRLVPDSLQIDFTAGYTEGAGSPTEQAEAAENVPDSLKLWMHARIATLYEQREQLIVGTIVAQVPWNFADGMLDELRTGIF